MYITITAQKTGSTFGTSSADFVAYLEKENEGRSEELQEHFFDQNHDRIAPEKIVKEIDSNTAKLKKNEPKFYSITLNPSQRELKQIGNDPKLLKNYVREVMKDYAASFYRDKSVNVADLKYYAKIEYQRTFKGFDREVKENAVYRSKITKLEQDLVKIERGELDKSKKKVQDKISRLKKDIPHRLDGKIIEQGMKKPGLQTHVHIIMSRKDVSNQFSLSPGSKYMESQSTLNGKVVKRGFNRDYFFDAAEKRFDKLFGYDRNYVESYKARKQFQKEPQKFYANLLGLPTSQRSIALKLLGKSGVHVPTLSIPTNKVQIALKSIKHLKKAIGLARDAGSIGI